jgi:hypothetical protein
MRLTKADLFGLAANTVGVIAVAASEAVGIGEYLAILGVGVATIGMALMYLSRFQKFIQ